MTGDDGRTRSPRPCGERRSRSSDWASSCGAEERRRPYAKPRQTEESQMSQTLQTMLTPLPGEVKVKAKMKTKMKADVAHARAHCPATRTTKPASPRRDTRRASPLGSASKKNARDATKRRGCAGRRWMRGVRTPRAAMWIGRSRLARVASRRGLGSNVPLTPLPRCGVVPWRALAGHVVPNQPRSVSPLMVPEGRKQEIALRRFSLAQG